MAIEARIRELGVRHQSLERAIEFIEDDELVEVTPKSIRIRRACFDRSSRSRRLRRCRASSNYSQRLASTPCW